MQRTWRLAALLLVVWAGQCGAAAAVPDSLQSWQGWVLRGEEFRACPFLALRTPGEQGSHRCAWPGTLALDLDAAGGSFRQSWQVYADSWIVLPGSLEHWPRDVRIDGSAAAVVTRNGLPQLRIAAGTHAITGNFAWALRPEVLPVPTQTAIVQLTLDGRSIAQPERPAGAVWLGQRRAAVEREQLDLQVYRLLRDEIPARLLTRLQLQVSGAGREVLLGKVLPEGFIPMALEGDLPARLEPDGRLRVQLRPGSFELTLEARAPSVAGSISRPEAAAPWPEDEVWSFEGMDRLRVAAVENAAATDPVQAEVPDDWSELPAFRIPAGSALTVVERSRALANPDDNQLHLVRDLWLDFNHQGFTATDRINGSLHRDWRLELAPPYALESARAGDESLLVTVGADDASGIELRDQQIQLATSARVQRGRGGMPATGWSTRFDSVEGTLHLPPGHRLLGVLGADSAPGSWLDRWGLWNLFGVLIVVAITFWVAGRSVAVVAAMALLLMYQELPEMIWLWANVLAASAIARAAPEGKLRRHAGHYRIASLAVLVLALVPLMIGQLRLALYPELAVNEGASKSITANLVAELAPAVMLDMPAPASPAIEAPDSMEKQAGSAEDSMQEVQVTSSRIRYDSVTSRYAAGTLLQTGPGIPNWQYNDYSYRWSGPVEPSQTLRFVYIGPPLLGIWRVAAVLLTALFALLLARTAFNLPLRLPGLPVVARRSAAMLVLATTLMLGAIPAPSHAQAYPTPEMLEELKSRLTAAPSCIGSCAEIMSAQVQANGDRLEVTLDVSALTALAIALPHADDRWQMDRVEVDGRSAAFAARESDNTVWMPLNAGAHRIVLGGRLANAESVQLNFPQPPRTIRVTSSGWDSSGVSNGRLLSGSLELTRRRAAGTAAAELAPSEFTPFVQVTRTFRLDLDWSIHTSVERIAPRAAPLQVQVPLVAGEAVLTEGVEVLDGNRAAVGLARGQHAMNWESRLARSEAFDVTLPADAPRNERWIFAVSPQWHAEFSGMPASLPDNAGSGQWTWQFFPRAGETLNVKITRPAAASGRTFAIDSVDQSSEFGKRSVNGRLELDYRSTQGGRQVITLPETARVTEVTVDDQPVPVRPDKGQLPLSLLPGEHTIAIRWTAPRGAGLTTRPDRIDLGSPASNINTTVTLPYDRWPLLVHGAGAGSTLLYWGELCIFALVAAGLSLWKASPLRFIDWLLLGLGLSTLSWSVFAAVAVWLLAMRWRAGWDHTGVKRWSFNMAQFTLAAFTVIAVSSLVFSGVRYGLLATPDMSLSGPNGYTSEFQWFMDRAESLLPQPVIISVPMWVYRLLMFCWALWIAMSLSRWLRSAWQAWTAGGFWRGTVTASTKA